MVGGRPRKTQEELDQEMDAYWGNKKETGPIKTDVIVQAAESTVIAEDDDVDMIT